MFAERLFGLNELYKTFVRMSMRFSKICSEYMFAFWSDLWYDIFKLLLRTGELYHGKGKDQR